MHCRSAACFRDSAWRVFLLIALLLLLCFMHKPACSDGVDSFDVPVVDRLVLSSDFIVRGVVESFEVKCVKDTRAAYVEISVVEELKRRELGRRLILVYSGLKGGGGCWGGQSSSNPEEMLVGDEYLFFVNRSTRSVLVKYEVDYFCLLNAVYCLDDDMVERCVVDEASDIAGAMFTIDELAASIDKCDPCRSIRSCGESLIVDDIERVSLGECDVAVYRGRVVAGRQATVGAVVEFRSTPWRPGLLLPGFDSSKRYYIALEMCEDALVMPMNHSSCLEIDDGVLLTTRGAKVRCRLRGLDLVEY